MEKTFTDLAEHTGTLVAILGCLLVICGGLIAIVYRKLDQGVAEVKSDTISAIKSFHEELSKEVNSVGQGLNKHLVDAVECQRNLPKLYMSKEDGIRDIALLFSRQNDLRERTLPHDYVRRTEMEALSQSLTRLIDRGFNDLGTRVDKLSDRLDQNLELKKGNGRDL
jgi:hypothetical protein